MTQRGRERFRYHVGWHKVSALTLGRRNYAENFRSGATCRCHVCWIGSGGSYVFSWNGARRAQAHDPGLHRGPTGRCDMRLRYSSWQTIAVPEGAMVPLPLHERLHAVKRLIRTRAQAAKLTPDRDLGKFG